MLDFNGEKKKDSTTKEFVFAVHNRLARTTILELCGPNNIHIVGNSVISAACRNYFTSLCEANIKNIDILITEVKILSAISHTITPIIVEDLKKPIQLLELHEAVNVISKEYILRLDGIALIFFLEY